jgi:hypothetical protein
VESAPAAALVEVVMMRWLGVAAMLALLAGCSGGAREVDYPPERGISADIAASRYSGPTSLYPGMSESGELEGVMPWQLDERHQ